MSILKKLTIADYCSLTALFFAWVSILLLIYQQPLVAILVNVGGAFVFDVLDGYIARTRKIVTVHGKQLDSFIDVVTYLVFSAVLYSLYIAPTPFIGSAIGFIILCLGILRLVRFTNEGLVSRNNRMYYNGMPVYYIYLLVLACFFISTLFPYVNSWFVSAIIVLVCPLMISNRHFYKITNMWAIAGTVVMILGVSLFAMLWK